MNLNDFDTLDEVISKNNFHLLLDQVFLHKDNVSKDVLVDYIMILGDKFSKFCDYNELKDKERSELSNMLIGLTDFTDFVSIEQLIGIMFYFRLDDYCLYLKGKLLNIYSDVIIKEIQAAIIEYEASL